MSKKKRMIKIFFAIIVVLVGFDFIPVKMAVKMPDDGIVFVTEPKLSLDTSWASYKYVNGTRDFSSVKLYLPSGCIPGEQLNKNDFDSIDLHLIPGDNVNKFLWQYKEQGMLGQFSDAPIYKADVKDWDIVYPIQRATFRRYYAPKNYLTIYDYDWWQRITSLFDTD